MALKTVLETLEGVDDATKALYTQKDDQFILDIDGVDQHPDVANLRSAFARKKDELQQLRQKVDDAEARLKSVPDDFDAEKWTKLKDGKPDEAALVSLRKELEADLGKAIERADRAEAQLLKASLDRDLSDALTAAGVTNVGLLEGARALLVPKIKMDQTGKPVVDTDMGEIAVPEFVKKWAADSGKAFVTPSSGGGSKGGNGADGPVTPEQFAKMGDRERTELYQSDPETFRKLSGK